jgi:hypothetical protein
MKSNYKIIAAIFAAASAWCANGQSVRPAAPTAEPVPAADIVFEPSPSPKTSPRRVTVSKSSQIAAGNYPVSVYGYSSRSSSDSIPPVVIQFGAKDASAIGAMEDDLAVMTHIIDRAVDRVGEDVPDALGVPLIYTSGGRSVRALYLDGFGPLVMVKVNFPVHAPGEAQPKAVERTESSEWEEAKRALYGANRETTAGSSSSAAPYDGGRVEALKKHLITALKEASNMKGVKPDESVSVTVFGSPAAAASGNGVGRVSGSRGVGVINSGAAPGRVGQPPADWPSQSTNLELVRTTLQGTVLTLRARKSDIDAAAKGGLDDEAFMKKVTVNTYSGNGYGVKSVNSWIRSSSSSAYQAR